ncbi:MAG: hypothetical protein Q9198_006127 [Flavoplaca austrocitrina]
MPDVEQATERSHLLPPLAHDRRFSAVQNEADANSILSTHVSKEEQLLATTSVGERLPYNDYTTIDWLHDLTPFDLESSTPSLVFAATLAPLSSPVKVGLLQP